MMTLLSLVAIGFILFIFWFVVVFLADPNQ